MTGAPSDRDPGGGPLRVAVMGAGLMGYWHAAEAGRAGGLLVGVADRSPGAAAALAGAHADARPFDDLDALLVETAPEVLHVCTPTDSHVGLVERALDAGVHVLAEKPLAPDAHATEQLLSRAHGRRLALCPVHQYVLQAGVESAVRARAALGALVHMEATACSAGAGLPGAPPADAIAGEILPHPLSVLQRLLPVDLGEIAWDASRPARGELRAAAEARETTLSVRVSMSGRPPRNELRVIAEHGTFHMDFFHGYGLLERGGLSRASKVLRPFRLSARSFAAAGANLARRVVRREAAYPGLRELITGFYAAVRGAGPVPIPAREALAVARARDRILSASQSPRRAST